MAGVKIREERCKGCSLCLRVCPRGFLWLATRTNTKGFHPVEVVPKAECTGCALCALMCPDLALTVFR
ncbi:MAG: 4Fe-4S binding protein [Limnochordia bacterium]